MSNKSYRIRTNIGEDSVIKASLTQDIEFLEVLSLKIKQENTYRLHVSNYGVIVGRVLANDSFGIPNAKVSVFVALSDEDAERQDIINVYPYQSMQTIGKNNKRYNLLSSTSSDDCAQIVGTFPSKRLVLDDDTELEIYGKYWKYTTVTNQSGDYMIFGVPTGNQTVHVDIDLSDIGILSQKPRDFFSKGFNKEQFESPEQFKGGDNLDSLTQILTQNSSVYVYPFFGDSNIDDIAITRCDIKVPYKFEPTCVFFGSVISDKAGHHLGHKCGPTRWMGDNKSLVTGEGTIEMIRKTQNGLVEEFSIKANKLIDNDGVWCYQIPMNLDYVGTDEFGNIVPVQDGKHGIPTRTSVRFRFSLQGDSTMTSTEHTAKYLVPNIHELDPSTVVPHLTNGSTYDRCYEFGSSTPDEFFRDLLWNKVYTVKSFIPRFENLSAGEKVVRWFSPNSVERNYTGIRSVNEEHQNNIFPFNNARFRISFTYRIKCVIAELLIELIASYNKLISNVLCWELFKDIDFLPTIRPFEWLTKYVHCVGFSGERFLEERNNIYYAPGCDGNCGSIIKNQNELEVVTEEEKFIDTIQQALSKEHTLVYLDFMNDWVNGVLYFPLWYWKKSPKKLYMFGLIKKKGVNTFCSCDKKYKNNTLTETFSSLYDFNFTPIIDNNGNDYHLNKNKIEMEHGIIKEFTNRDNLNVYYYAPGIPTNDDYRTNNGLVGYQQLFATDIVLLGSFNSCDFDNLPKMFDSLPKTTANVPLITYLDKDDTGDGIISGMDWGYDGDSDKHDIKYQDGLLMGLTCTNVNTHYKSGVNLSRLSELFVSYDRDMTIENEGDMSIKHDGMIGKDEIVDNEVRAKFASLNHNGLMHMQKNPNTEYTTYKLKYIYPTDFDGRLENLGLVKERYNFHDVSDNNYLMFRFGEGKDSLNGQKHIKHFYINQNNIYSFPLYNNSFYFYFGLNIGKTAIEKFNNLYGGSCSKPVKDSFTMKYTSKPGKWCYDKTKNEIDFGTIDVEFNGLTDIFSYALYNEFNELIVSEKNVQSKNLCFGYDIQTGGGSYVTANDGYKKDGRIKYFNNGELVTNENGEPVFLINGVYYLQVFNSFGQSVTQRINLLQNSLYPLIETRNLGTKVFDNETTAESLCGSKDYNGEIIIKSFIVDGQEVFIKELDTKIIDGVERYYEINGNIVYPLYNEVVLNTITYEEQVDDNGKYYIDINGTIIYANRYEKPKEVVCQVKCTDGSIISIVLEKEEDDGADITSYLCYGVNSSPSVTMEKQGSDVYSLIFNVWRQGDYKITSNQVCDSVLNDNINVSIVSIENGDLFNAYINEIPFKLIHNDYFKNKISASNNNFDFSNAWLQLENPNIYSFENTTKEKINFWSEFMDVSTMNYVINDNENIESVSVESKLKILDKQLYTISEMRNISYIMGERYYPRIILSANGGKEPILFRNVHPDYSNIETLGNISNKYTIENSQTLEAPIAYPHIVDKNYGNVGKIGLNTLIYKQGQNTIGNYFAVFTNNGGIINLNDYSTTYDKNLFVESKPENVNPLPSITTFGSYSVNSLPTQIIADGKEYLKTMFVDKRLIFNSEIISPINCNYDIESDDIQWRSGHLNLKISNIAPLIYDENYNIIGDGLSYEIKSVTNEIYDEHGGKTGELNYENKDGIHYLTPTEDSYFYECFKNGTISGEDEEEVYSKFKKYSDNIAEIISFSLSGSTFGPEIYYKKLEKITNIDKLKEDVNIKLVSNLIWDDGVEYVDSQKSDLAKNARLYKCSLSVDGNEIDLRDKFENTLTCINGEEIAYGEIQGGVLLPVGNQLNISASNCIMDGHLHYEIQNVEDDKKTYNFSSYVKSGDLSKIDFNFGEKIEINSCAFNYMPTKSNKYFVWDNDRIYLNELNPTAKLKTYSFYSEPLDYEKPENEYKLLINSGGTIVELFISDKDDKHFATDSEEVETSSLSGYLYTKKRCIEIPDGIAGEGYETQLNNFINEMFGGDVDVENVLNEHGCTVYIHYNDIADNSLWWSFNPYTKGQLKTPVHLQEKNGYDVYKIDKYLLVLTKIEFLSNLIPGILSKTGCFYEKMSDNINGNIISGNTSLPFKVVEENSKFYLTTTKKYPLKDNSNITITDNFAEMYYYCPISKEYDDKFLFETNKIKDGKSIEINSKTFTFEKNELNNSFYCHYIDNNEDCYQKMYELYFTYEQKGGIFEQTKNIYYNGPEGVNFPSGWNVEDDILLSDNYLIVNELEDISEDDEKNIIQINNTYFINKKVSYEYNMNQPDYIKINGEIYPIYSSNVFALSLHDVENFTCYINNDLYNDEYDRIDNNPPFLSYGLIKNYGFDGGIIEGVEIGDKIFAKGKVNYINLLSENNQIENARELNNNVHFGTTDENYLIGEMYSYINSEELQNDENGIQFVEKGYLGNDYGKYIPLVSKHQWKHDVGCYCNLSTYKQNYRVEELSDNDNFRIKTIESLFNYYIENNGEIIVNHSDKLYESDELDVLNVYQPQTNNEIKNGVEVISCNYVKVYSNSNNDLRKKEIKTYSQNLQMHVGPLYFGKATFANNMVILPTYIIDGYSNVDLSNALKERNFTYYVNNEIHNFNPDDLGDDTSNYTNLTLYGSMNLLGGGKYELLNKLYTTTPLSHEEELQNKLIKKVKSFDNINNNLYLVRVDDTKLNVSEENKVRPLYHLKKNDNKITYYEITGKFVKLKGSSGKTFTAIEHECTKGLDPYTAHTKWQIELSNTTDVNNLPEIEISFNPKKQVSDFSRFFSISDTNREGISIGPEGCVGGHKIEENGVYGAFNNVWQNTSGGTNVVQFDTLELNDIKNLSDDYSSGTCETFFNTLISICEGENEENCLNGNIITVNIPNRAYYVKGEWYFSTYHEPSISGSTGGGSTGTPGGGSTGGGSTGNTPGGEPVVQFPDVTILPNDKVNSEFTIDNNDLTANTNNQIEVFSDLVPSTGTTDDTTIGGNDNNDNNDNVIIDGLVGVNFVVINGLSYTEKSIIKDGYEEFYIDVRGVRYYGYDTIIFDKLQKNEYESVDMTLYDPYTKTEIHKTNSAFTKLINSCRFTINPDETLRMYDGVTTESLANSIRDRLNNDEDLKIYDYRFDGYPIKVTDTPKIKQVGYYNWNYYLNVTSDLLNDADDTTVDYDDELLKDCDLLFKTSGNLGVIKYDNDDMFNYENNYPISTLKSDDIIIIPYSIAELTPQEVVLIICDDGYTELHSSTEVITCVNKDGDKIQQSCEYFEQLGWLGYYLPHKENVNDDVYEFISKITNVRKLKSFYCFKWNDSGLYHDVLSIKIGNIVYKTNLRISNNTLNFGAFDV